MFLAVRCHLAANDLGIFGTNLSARPRCRFCIALHNPHDHVAANSDFRPVAAVFCTNKFDRYRYRVSPRFTENPLLNVRYAFLRRYPGN